MTLKFPSYKIRVADFKEGKEGGREEGCDVYLSFCCYLVFPFPM